MEGAFSTVHYYRLYLMLSSTNAPVNEIPIYREGSSAEESTRLIECDPVNFHLRALKLLGPVYRVTINSNMVIMFAGLAANEFIWKNTELWTYHNLLAAFREELGDDHVTAIDGPHHRQKRTILKPAFDQAPALRYLPQFNAIFHKCLGSAAALKKLDAVYWWAKTICRAQSKTVAQADISEEALDQLIGWEKALLSGIRLGEKRIIYYGDPGYRKMKAAALGLMGRMVEERLADPGKYDDNFAMVMQARLNLEGPKVNRENLIDDLYLILLAGVENTSKLICAALTGTLRNPSWLAKLRTELDTWDGHDVMALSGMNRLKATVMEAQRFFPAITYNFREAVQPFAFGGYHFPTGTNIHHMQTICHYLEEHYLDPHEFKPERFLEDGKFVAKTNGIFGGGTHVCLGRNHTLLQTPIALAQMIKYYNIEILEEVVTSGVAHLAPGQSLNELWLRVTPRKP